MELGEDRCLLLPRPSAGRRLHRLLHVGTADTETQYLCHRGLLVLLCGYTGVPTFDVVPPMTTVTGYGYHIAVDSAHAEYIVYMVGKALYDCSR